MTAPDTAAIRAQMKAPKLLPCPFCGGKNVSVFGPVGWDRKFGIRHTCSVFYGGSGEFTIGARSRVTAISDWNSRADIAAEQVREAYERGLDDAEMAVAKVVAPISGTPYSAGPRAFCEAIRVLKSDDTPSPGRAVSSVAPATIVPAILANVAGHLAVAGYHDAEEYVRSEFIAGRAMSAAVFAMDKSQEATND